MALQFEHVLAGVAVRTFEEEREPLVQRCRPAASRKRCQRSPPAAPAGHRPIDRLTDRARRRRRMTRTMPTPPRPGAVATATMVSAVGKFGLIMKNA
jgi:hypothetical protein